MCLRTVRRQRRSMRDANAGAGFVAEPGPRSRRSSDTPAASTATRRRGTTGETWFPPCSEQSEALRGFGLVADAPVEPLLQAFANVLAGDGRREARAARLEADDRDGRVIGAVTPRPYLRFRQRPESPHVS